MWLPDLKILLLNNYHFIRGGSERYFLDQKALLERHGHQVITFSTYDERNESTSPDSVLVPQANFNRPGPGDLIRFHYSTTNRKRLARFLSETRPDIAHLHIWYGQLTASVLRELAAHEIPSIQTLHEYRLYCPVSTFYRHGTICQRCKGKSFWQATIGRCNRGSIFRSALSTTESYLSHWLGAEKLVSHFLTVSNFQRNILINCGLPAEKTSTLHNFKNTDGIVPSYTDGEYFLYFGRLERSKGIFTLLKAAARLKGTRFVIAGDGIAATELREFASTRQLDNVKFVGFQSGDALEELIRGSICSLLPSEWWETFGLTSLESFALGRPVIASRIGGIPEVVDDGVNGFLVDPGSDDQLADAIQRLDRDRTLARDLGKAGRSSVERLFGPEKHYQALLEIYQTLTSRRPSVATNS